MNTKLFESVLLSSANGIYDYVSKNWIGLDELSSARNASVLANIIMDKMDSNDLSYDEDGAYTAARWLWDVLQDE